MVETERRRSEDVGVALKYKKNEDRRRKEKSDVVAIWLDQSQDF